MLVPLAVNGSTEQHQAPTADDTILVQQPLAGVGGGETIREISQATPFSMVALTGNDLFATAARVRAKRPDGT